ncbi:MAG: hypothetical protein ACRCYU_12995 [Nocardioides sp.]
MVAVAGMWLLGRRFSLQAVRIRWWPLILPAAGVQAGYARG